MKINVNGMDIFYEKTGTGRPLLMVHGNGEDHKIFDEAIALLKEKYTCYAVDSRNHGESGKAEVLHYDDMASDMIGLMEALDLNDVIFYGFSDGGIIGLLSAIRCPRITTLIVSGANMDPDGVKRSLKTMIKLMNWIKRDTKLELMLNEPHITEKMLGGMNASAKITLQTRENVLTVPVEALCERETDTVVYTGYDESAEELTGPVTVETGLSDGVRTEIRSGLSEGERIWYSYYENLTQ